jgi:poly-gamma-glutamate synthase PgsB/CapB
LITAERQFQSIFAKAAGDRESRFVEVAEDEVLYVTDEEMSRFSYEEHRENVALALRVCSELGVDREAALAGMWSAVPDPGATLTYELDFCGRRILFVSAFAANDPTSTERIWHAAWKQHPRVENRIALFNCRSDRADRSRQLGRACVEWDLADHYVLTGTGTQAFIRSACAAGLDPRTIHQAERESPVELFETLVDLAGCSALIVGMGNIGDNGLDIARVFRYRGRLQPRIAAKRFSIKPAIEPAQTIEPEPELQMAAAGRMEPAPSPNGKH